MKPIAFLLILALIAARASAAEIAVAFTDDTVDVDAGFAGARVTLFGAVAGIDDPQGAVDLIAVIRGPAASFHVRRLQRRNLIWMPGDVHAIKSAPGLYLTAATRPIADIAPLPDQAAFRLGAHFLDFEAETPHENAESDDYRRPFIDAFISEFENRGLYDNRIGAVSFKKGALFVIEADLPANTPVGEYGVAVYLYQDGRLLGQDSARLLVDKVGLERRIYELAHRRPVSYGFLCVALSLFAGWIAALVFRT